MTKGGPVSRWSGTYLRRQRDLMSGACALLAHAHTLVTRMSLLRRRCVAESVEPMARVGLEFWKRGSEGEGKGSAVHGDKREQ